MARSGTLKVRIIGDDGPLQKTLGGATSRVGKFGAAAVAAGAAAAAAFGVKAVGAASDLEQSIGAVESVFGDAAGRIQKFGETAANAFGLSRREVNESAAVLGASLQGMGFDADTAASQVITLQERAADMAATFGGTTTEALESISSLLRGERDPIEKYGVALKQADINARIMALGLDTSTAEMQKQAEATAALDLLMEKSASSSGAFSREQDTLAGKTAQLRAKFENFQAQVGERIIPLILAAWERLEDWWATNGPAIQAFLGAVGDRVVELGRQFAAWWQDDVQPALQAVWDAVQTNGPRIQGIFEDVGATVEAVGETFSTVMSTMSRETEDGAADVEGSVSDVITVFEVLGETVRVVTEFVSSATGAQVRVQQAAGETIGKAIGRVIEIFHVLRGAVLELRDAWVGAKERMAGAAEDMKARVLGVFSDAPEWLSTAGRQVVQGFIDGIVGMIPSAVTAVAEFAGRAVQAAKDKLKIQSPSLVFHVFGENTVQGYIDGIQSKASALKATVTGVFADVVSGVGGILGGLGAVAGRDAAQAAVDAAQAAVDAVAARRDELPGLIDEARVAMLNSRDEGQKVTSEERMRIIQAKKGVENAEKALADVRKDDEATLLDLEEAETRLALAQDALTTATEDARKPTQEYLDAKRRWEELTQEQATITAELEKAEDRLTQAKVRAVEAEVRMFEAGQTANETTDAQITLLLELAEQAGVSAEEMQPLIDQFLGLGEAARDANEAIEAAVRAQFKLIGHDPGQVINPEDMAVLGARGGSVPGSRTGRDTLQATPAWSWGTAGGRPSGSRGSDGGLTIQINGGTFSSRQVVDEIHDGLVEKLRRTPGLGFA